MSGSYGWNIENTEEFVENEGEYVKTTMPIGINEGTTSESPNPYIKGYYWCASSGEIPGQAIKAGIDKDGGDLYVGRALHEGELQPAKIVPNHGCAYIAYEESEIRKDDYEILCANQATIIWQECQHGGVPPNAVPGGCTAENERLFIGRVFHDGTHTPGKIQPSLGGCYIPYGGESNTKNEVQIANGLAHYNNTEQTQNSSHFLF